MNGVLGIQRKQSWYTRHMCMYIQVCIAVPVLQVRPIFDVLDNLLEDVNIQSFDQLEEVAGSQRVLDNVERYALYVANVLQAGGEPLTTANCIGDNIGVYINVCVCVHVSIHVFMYMSVLRHWLTYVTHVLKTVVLDLLVSPVLQYCGLRVLIWR